MVVAHPGRVAPARVDRLTDALREAMDEVATLTRTARRPELAVVIYDDREAMRRATCAPSWSGGIFDGVLHLDVATVNGSRGMRVARHEATHAQLATLRGRVPHWLNEGLAQHLEGAPSRATRAAWARMVAQRFWIPFASLEGQLVVIDDPDDAQLAYHQSLAMVRYLLDARGDAGLAEAARHVEAGEARDLLERLVPSADGEALLAFLAAEGLAR
ncbi:MAG TPA: peptidase MA family metallohydrolase [Sandaracinaceae bacterium LLY-WYZ-13_1]|nr:peptidase MA family metallohydrolase [Sandaracinaceae bacterium LLY-WYZ-13_1]